MNDTNLSEEQRRSLSMARAKEKEARAAGGEPFDLNVAAQEAYQARVTRPLGRLNKGIIDLINAPTSLANAGIGILEWPFRETISLPRIGGSEQLKESAYRVGFIPDPEVPAEGILQNTMEFLGAGALPTLGLYVRGQAVMNRAVEGLKRLGLLDHLALSTAKYPAYTVVGEVASSLAAATAGEMARKSEFVKDSANSDTYVVLAELLGGLQPAALMSSVSRLNMPRVIWDHIKKTLLPMMEKGARPRAMERLQSLSADPEAAAAKIDVDELLPASRQVGEERLLALEKAILKEDPVLTKEYEETFRRIRAALTDETAAFGGDKGRTRKLLRVGRDYLVGLVNYRASKAAADAAEAIARLKPDATERELSDTVRVIVNKAYEDGRASASEFWEALNSKAPGAIEDFTNTFRNIVSRRSEKKGWSNPKDIPSWIARDVLKMDPLTGRSLAETELMDSLRKQGLLNADGTIVVSARQGLKDAGIIGDDGVIRFKPEEATFNDMKELRTRLLEEFRQERGSSAPNRNKLRILHLLANGDPKNGIKGLLDDMERAMIKAGGSDLEEYRSARAYSDQLNERFLEGNVGKLMGVEVSGAQRITDEMTLAYLLRGGDTQDPVANIRQLMVASPEIRPLVEEHMKLRFLSQTINDPDKGFSKDAANQFISNWERKGLFDEDVFPELRAQLEGVRNLEQGAARLGVRADKVSSLAYDVNKSRAALYLGKPVEEEMRWLLNEKEKMPAIARSLVAKVKRMTRNNPLDGVSAINGLKASFVEELFRRSAFNEQFLDDGSPVISGSKLTNTINEYKATAQALGMNKAEISRLERTASIFRKIEAKAPGEDVAIFEGAVARVMDMLARYLGAKMGARAGTFGGSSLVLAGVASREMRGVLSRLSTDHAKRLIIAAHQNTPDGRELYKALMAGSPDGQDSGAVVIARFFANIGVSVSAAEDLGRDPEQSFYQSNPSAALFAPATMITPYQGQQP